MALLQNIQYPNGTETNYHKISELHITPYSTQEYINVPTEEDDLNTEIRECKYYYIQSIVCSYVSKNIRENNSSNYLLKTQYSHKVSAEQVETLPIMSVAYAALKTEPVFSGAEDV